MANTSIGTAILADTERHQRLMAAVGGSQPVLDAFQSQQARQSRILASITRSPALEAFGVQAKTKDTIFNAVGRSDALAPFAVQTKATRLSRSQPDLQEIGR